MKKLLSVLAVSIAVFSFGIFSKAQAAVEYNPIINPKDFTTNITNPYFTLTPAEKFIYEAKTGDGTERIEILITGEKKTIMGVETLVYWDRVWVDNELVEDTRDYLAQDREGNVWYFGEDVDNYENGRLKDHDGAWLAGNDGAKPGIWMKANPQVGQVYSQEYYKGKAEDMAEVISITETVTVQGKTYTNCLKTYDYTPLDPEAKEYKYYCKEVGGLVAEEDVSGEERAELIEVTQIRSDKQGDQTKPVTPPAASAEGKDEPSLRNQLLTLGTGLVGLLLFGAVGYLLVRRMKK